MDKEKILIIDDSPVQANVLKSILKPDYEINTAHTAEAGLRYARNGSFSLILLDVVMPGMDGFALLKKLQDEIATQHTPVILITGLSDTESEERGLTLGAVDYITKPFYPVIVKARVNTHIKLRRYQLQIEEQVMVDQLTGVGNRRCYDIKGLARWNDAVRLRVPFSICMFDIDKFKVYNDTFGHPSGDQVIAAVAKTAASHLRRSTDLFVRYGGEEFVAIVIGGDAPMAFAHFCRIRQAIEDLHIPHNEKVSPWVTVSIGGVTLTPKPSDTFATCLKIADTMLYDAKRFGRNQVVWTNSHLEQLRER